MRRILMTTTAMMIAFPVLAQTPEMPQTAPMESQIETPGMTEEILDSDAEMSLDAELDADAETIDPLMSAEQSAPMVETAPTDLPAEEMVTPTPMPTAEPDMTMEPLPEPAAPTAAPEPMMADPAQTETEDLMRALEAETAAEPEMTAPMAEPAPVPMTEPVPTPAPAETQSETDALMDMLEAEQAAEAPVPAAPMADPEMAAPAPSETDALADALAAEAEAEAGTQPLPPVGTDMQTPAPVTAPMAPEATAPAEADPLADALADADAPDVVNPNDAAALQHGSNGEVQETTITEEQARSSNEEFRSSNDRSGISNDAKNVLFGLGGFALGHVLTDRSRVEMNTGDRIIVTNPQGETRVVKNDDAMLVMPGNQVSTENFADGSSRSIITRADGSQVITIRGADLTVLSRRIVTADGQSYALVDETVPVTPVDVRRLPAPVVMEPLYARDEAELRRAFTAVTPIDRAFSLQQILTIPEVRDLAPPVGVSDITFATGSAAISADQARSLLALGNVIRDMVARNPAELFLIEGHTDTVGNDFSNLALSDRRAETLAKALSEYFDVPVENLVVQGYGENDLLINREGDIAENRRAAVRRITPLLSGR